MKSKYTTILHAAGVAVPKEVAGQPLLPSAQQEFLFTEMNFHEPGLLRVQRTVRDGRFKLLLNLTADADQSPVEPFDLKTDPGETKNLADGPAHKDTRAKLEAALKSWRENTSDPTLDAARVKRWQDAAAKWGMLPTKPVHIPEGDLNLLD